MAKSVETIKINDGEAVPIRDSSAIHATDNAQITGVFSFNNGININGETPVISIEGTARAADNYYFNTNKVDDKIIIDIGIPTSGSEGASTELLTESEAAVKTDYEDGIIYFIIED